MISSLQNSDALLKELNLSELEGKEREDVLNTLKDRFDDVILSIVLKNLSEDQFASFKIALKSGNPEEEIAKITGSVEGLSEIIEERMHQEYQLIKSVMAA